MPLISFVTAIALASGITASVTLVRRGPTCTTGTGSLFCCGNVNTLSDLPDNVQSVVFADDPTLDVGISVGLDCSPFQSQGCNASTCCSDVNIVDLQDTADNIINVLPDCVSPVTLL